MREKRTVRIHASKIEGIMLNKTTKNNSLSKLSFGDLKTIERFRKNKIPEVQVLLNG